MIFPNRLSIFYPYFIYFFFISFCLTNERGFFFHFMERLCLRIPAAVGLLCVGFWRRVGVNTVLNKA